MSEKHICDFCDRSEDEVRGEMLVNSETLAAICSDCVMKCNETIIAHRNYVDIEYASWLINEKFIEPNASATTKGAR